MIRARFSSGRNGVAGFKISGHSGYADAGGDIVCAAVSSMTGLVIHIAADIYKDCGRVFQDEKSAAIEFFPEKTESAALVEGLYNQLSALAEEYPDYLSVERK